MEKVAQIFYNENYADIDELNESDRPQKFSFQIFNKTINKEIEECGKISKLEKKYNDLEILENIYKITPIIDIKKRFSKKIAKIPK